MNKLYRYILVGIFALIPCFCGAVDVYDIDTTSYTFERTFTNTTATNFYNHTNKNILVCFNGSTNGITVAYKMVDAVITRPNEAFFCIRMNDDYNGNYLRIDVNAGKTLKISVSELINPAECPVMSSLQCQTNYNLIPVESVTEQYCKLNYDLISPTECPTSEGTGAVNRTAWYINNEQYPGTASLNIFIPEFLKYSTTYNENETIVDIEGYNADEDYINNVIDQEKLTPTNEDFTNMILALTGFIPYLFIALLFFWIVRIINRIWK